MADMEINNIQCIKQILIPPSWLKEKPEIINSCHTPRIIQFKSSQWPEIVKNIKCELKTKIKQQTKPLQSHAWTQPYHEMWTFAISNGVHFAVSMFIWWIEFQTREIPWIYPTQITTVMVMTTTALFLYPLLSHRWELSNTQRSLFHTVSLHVKWNSTP